MEENKNTTILAEQQNKVLFQDVCLIIDQAQAYAYRLVNETLIKRNWLLGMRIQHDVLQGQRAEYGEQTIRRLAVQLIEKYGDSFSRRNLYYYLDFYKSFPNFFHAVSGKSIEKQIVNTARSQSGDNLKNILNSLRAKSPIKLSWTHYRIILQENTERGRVWYEQEAAREMWSTRTLPLSTLHICLQKRNCVER